MLRLLPLLLLFTLAHCKSTDSTVENGTPTTTTTVTTEGKVINHEGGQRTILLDSVAASEAIIIDRTDGFFDNIAIGDMSLQMRREPLESRALQLAAYRDFLQKDVADFTPDEALFVTKVFKDAYERVRAFDPAFYPDQIRLVKTKGKHYGPSVYYTREDLIVIPTNELQKQDREPFTTTMLHEIFHVWSRYHPEKRKELYALFGFTQELDPKPLRNVSASEDFSSRLLLNPDGVNYNYATQLPTAAGSTDSTYAVPLLYTAEAGYTGKPGGFFGALQFALFPIARKRGMWVVQEDAPINPYTSEAFMERIGKVTGYIIHPDEICADSFTFLVEAERNQASLDKYTERGRMLLRRAGEIMKR